MWSWVNNSGACHGDPDNVQVSSSCCAICLITQGNCQAFGKCNVGTWYIIAEVMPSLPANVSAVCPQHSCSIICQDICYTGICSEIVFNIDPVYPFGSRSILRTHHIHINVVVIVGNEAHYMAIWNIFFPIHVGRLWPCEFTAGNI
jgi:hypothetical protein